MKTVKIYIETSIRGPRVKDGKYAAVLVTTGTDGIHELIVTGEEEETTFNRCTLLAATRALQRMNQKCHVIIYTDNLYVTNMVEQGNPEKWRRAEWKKAAGSEVQNKELWKLFLEYAEKQDLEMKYCRCSEYTGKLQAVIHGEEIEDV